MTLDGRSVERQEKVVASLSELSDGYVRGTVDQARLVELQDGAEHGRVRALRDLVLASETFRPDLKVRRLSGELHSTEVAHLLLTQQPRV